MHAALANHGGAVSGSDTPIRTLCRFGDRRVSGGGQAEALQVGPAAKTTKLRPSLTHPLKEREWSKLVRSNRAMVDS